MPRGKFPSAYLHDPNIAHPIEEIYADMDAYTYEVFEDEPAFHHSVDFIVLVPPLRYEGRFVKGMFYSHGVDVIYERFPQVRHLFNSFAYSMWNSFPWSEQADASLVCYHNAAREAWYRKRHPDKAKRPLVPLQDADYTNEYRFAPVPVARKDIDILCVSRLSEVKNLPLLAQGLKIHRRKYPHSPIRMTLITGNKAGYGPGQLGDHAKGQLEAIERVLGRSSDYIDFVPHADHWKEMPQYYSRARVVVLGSLIEGKNRGLNEALSCNVPVVCFDEHNQFARQGHPLFPTGGGLRANYDPESFADTIQQILTGAEAFSPRLGYLRTNGRRNFLNQCIDYVPYYRHALPDYVPARHTENRWLDVAIQDNYQIGLHEFMYGQSLGVAHVSGLHNIERVVEYYRARFDI